MAAAAGGTTRPEPPLFFVPLDMDNATPMDLVQRFETNKSVCDLMKSRINELWPEYDIEAAAGRPDDEDVDVEAHMAKYCILGLIFISRYRENVAILSLLNDPPPTCWSY